MTQLTKFIYAIVFAMFVSLGFTSCMNHDFEPLTQAEEIQTKYDQAFVTYIGNPASEQTWGFGQIATVRATRAAYPNSNQWEDEGYIIPADITQAEIEKVLAVFNQKGEESYESLVDWDCFFVQQVWKGTASYEAGNGGTVIGGNQMDWLCAYDPVGKEETIYPDWNNWQATVVTNHDDHINNFNNASGSIMLMINSSTQRFGYKSSTDNGHVFYYFRMEEIDGAYYVGFDFSAEGQNPNEQVQRDFIYNDWIVKIVPGKGVSTPSNKVDYVGMIIAEDLSVNNATDFDFNDVVFLVGYKNNETYVKVLAAGGTLPLYIEQFEVHDVFGVDQNCMVNTKAELVGLKGEEKEAVELKLSDTKVDPVDIQVIVYKEGLPLPLLAPKGQPAAKIFINDIDFEWANERENLKVKYPDFGTWVTKGTPEIWWK